VLAGRLLGNRGEIELSRTELGLTLNSRSATLELSALRLGITLGASHSAAESCVVSHRHAQDLGNRVKYQIDAPSLWMATQASIFLPFLMGSTRQYMMNGVPSFL
jgi:hypothetical protein